MAQDWTTLRVSEDAKAQAEQNKRDDESWSDYLLRCSQNPPQEIEVVPVDEVVDRL